MQHRAAGRSRRYTIGPHGVWTPKEPKVLLGQVARGGNPAEEHKLNREAIAVNELCTRYLEDLNNGLVLGKRGRPKKATTISTDDRRIERRIVPSAGQSMGTGLAKSDITQAHEGHHVRQDTGERQDGQAARARNRARWSKYGIPDVGLFRGILTYPVELGIIEQNPVHRVRKPKDSVNARRLSD